MFGKVIGAVVGNKLAENTKGIGGKAGAAIGFAAPMLLRRLSLPAMLAIGAGGYAYKKYTERKDAQPDVPNRASTATA